VSHNAGCQTRTAGSFQSLQPGFCAACDGHCLLIITWAHSGLQEGQFLTESGEFRVAKPIGPARCVTKPW
jgi:hypothetical protein